MNGPRPGRARRTHTIPIKMRHDLSLEVGLVLNDSGDTKWDSCFLCHVDCGDDALVRVDPSEERQIGVGVAENVNTLMSIP